MKKLSFNNNNDGFYGTYYINTNGADNAIIGLFGDDPNDFMAKCGVKWLHKNGVNVMCMSPDVKNYSHVNYPLERIETAIKWLKNNGNKKIGIMISYGKVLNKAIKMVAKNGLFRMRPLFRGKENLLRICLSFMNTLHIIKK